MRKSKGKHSAEKSLIKFRENSLFFKIINFIKSLFIKEKIEEKEVPNVEEDIVPENPDILKEKTLEEKLDAYAIEDEKNRQAKLDENTILDIQKQYEMGTLDETSLSTNQINALYSLYVKQINELRQSNDFKKEKIEEYRENRKKG